MDKCTDATAALYMTFL